MLPVLLSLAALAAPHWTDRVADADTTVIDSVQPMPTRAGWLRYHDDRIATAEAVPGLLKRLGEPGEPAQRRALADAAARALPAVGGWTDAWVDLIRTESDVIVRNVLVGGLRHADADTAVAGLRAALAHDDAATRAEGARVAAWNRGAGSQLSPELRKALADSDERVRARAAKSLEILRLD